MKTLLKEAREIVACYWDRIGFPKDAVTVRAGAADYSADVQCVLACLIAKEKNFSPSTAVTAAAFYPHEHGSKSRNYREEDKYAPTTSS